MRDAEADRAAGLDSEQICRKLAISPATYHQWRNQYGRLKANQMKQLKHLQRGIARAFCVSRAARINSNPNASAAS